MIQIILPVPPNRANDRSHWKKVMNEKENYYCDCGWLLRKQVGNISKKPIEFAEWEASIEVARYYDADNIVALLKWPIDALKYDKQENPNGIILSDDWMHFRPRSYPKQILKPKRNEKRELRITLYPRGPWED